MRYDLLSWISAMVATIDLKGQVKTEETPGDNRTNALCDFESFYYLGHGSLNRYLFSDTFSNDEACMHVTITR